MKYWVTLAVSGRCEIDVEAKNFDEAKQKACEKFYDADIGDLECVDWKAINAEDETGKFVDY